MFPPQFLVGSRIATGVDIGSKKRLLEKLSELLATGDEQLEPGAVFTRFLERERMGSTGVGHGVALPHARMKEIRRPIGAFVRLTRGVDFDAADDRPVDLAFALLVPESNNELALRLLAELAERFDDPKFRERIRAAPTVEALLAAFEQSEELASDP